MDKRSQPSSPGTGRGTQHFSQRSDRYHFPENLAATFCPSSSGIDMLPIVSRKTRCGIKVMCIEGPVKRFDCGADTLFLARALCVAERYEREAQEYCNQFVHGGVPSRFAAPPAPFVRANRFYLAYPKYNCYPSAPTASNPSSLRMQT